MTQHYLKRKDLDILLRRRSLCYTILRRAIQQKGYTTAKLEQLTYAIEDKSIEQLEQIHKKWIGYL